MLCNYTEKVFIIQQNVAADGTALVSNMTNEKMFNVLFYNSRRLKSFTFGTTGTMFENYGVNQIVKL